jgi:hypothetical protein
MSTLKQRPEYVAQIKANREQFEKDHPGLADRIRTHKGDRGFLYSMALRLEQLGKLTPKQVEVAERILGTGENPVGTTIDQFIEHLNTLANRAGVSYRFTAARGKKYTKVVGSGAYCFIDAEGNIYKAESWSRPAKGVRARLATLDLRQVDLYTSWLYR